MAKQLRVLKTGHTVHPVEKEELENIHKHFVTYGDMIRLQPGGLLLFSSMADAIDDMHTFDFKPTDTIVTTYPKSGTTWMLEIVWTLTHNPDLNNPDADISADIRSPHIEADAVLLPPKIPKLTNDSEVIKALTKAAPHRLDDKLIFRALLEEVVVSPRVIKSHLPPSVFPAKMLETSKMIYVARDPRDIIISKFLFFREFLIHKYIGTLDEFVDNHLNDQHTSDPFWGHIKAAYDLKDHPNFKFIYFEDLKGDPFKTITELAKFLNLERTPKQIQNVVDHTNFRNMKARTDSGQTDQPMSDGGRFYERGQEGFFRKGKSGNWKESFTPEQIDKITKWMKKNMEMFPDGFKYKENL